MNNFLKKFLNYLFTFVFTETFRNEFCTTVDENVPAKSTTIEFSFPTYPRYENSTKFIIPGRKEENIGSRPVRKSVETLTDPESRGVNPGISVQTQTSGLGENPRTFGDFSSNISADSKHFSETCTVVADFGKQIVLTNTNSEHIVSTATQSKKSADRAEQNRKILMFKLCNT